MLVGIVCPSMNRRPVAPTGAAAGAPAGQSAPAASDEAAEPATNGHAGVLAVFAQTMSGHMQSIAALLRTATSTSSRCNVGSLHGIGLLHHLYRALGIC